MVKYRMEKEDGQEPATYTVVENETMHVMRSGLSKNKANALMRHLNFGGGFDGCTPEFFLQERATAS